MVPCLHIHREVVGLNELHLLAYRPDRTWPIQPPPPPFEVVLNVSHPLDGSWQQWPAGRMLAQQLALLLEVATVVGAELQRWAGPLSHL